MWIRLSPSKQQVEILHEPCVWRISNSLSSSSSYQSCSSISLCHLSVVDLHGQVVWRNKKKDKLSLTKNMRQQGVKSNLCDSSLWILTDGVWCLPVSSTLFFFFLILYASRFIFVQFIPAHFRLNHLLQQ